MEMKHYEILLKRAKVEAMKIELKKLSPKNIFLNGISDKRLFAGNHNCLPIP